jgi:hypothetical protein
MLIPIVFSPILVMQGGGGEEVGQPKPHPSKGHRYRVRAREERGQPGIYFDWNVVQRHVAARIGETFDYGCTLPTLLITIPCRSLQVLDEFKENNGISGAVQSLYHIASKVTYSFVCRNSTPKYR